MPPSDPSPVLPALKREQANALLLYLRYKGYHWNVAGPNFPELHRLFDEHAKTVLDSIDELAERQRMLGAPAGYAYEELRAVASLAEERRRPVTPAEMVEQLLAAHRTIVDGLREGFKVADKHGDPASADLFARLCGAHEKMAWFLRETAVAPPSVPEEAEARSGVAALPHGTAWTHASPIPERPLT